MGSVIPLKKSANSAYLELKNLLGNKLQKVEDLIEQRLKSEVDLIEKMSDHHLKSGGKRLRALLTLESAKLTGYKEGNRDINLAACVELIHSATLLHDDVIDESSLRRGVKSHRECWSCRWQTSPGAQIRGQNRRGVQCRSGGYRGTTTRGLRGY